LRLAALEPYFGGSHRQFLQGLQRHSRHRVELFTLPPRLWKWRVRGSALQLARALNEAGEFDALLCSDFVNVADLRALLNPTLRAKPVLYYLHENQLSYPLSPEEEFDPYFGFTNVLSCLSAEAVAFNSNFHCREFLARLPTFLPRLPDYDRRWVVTSIGAKSEVLPLGLDLGELERHRPPSPAAVPTTSGAPRVSAGRPPRRILWNHRWEFDKDPERFFRALDRLMERQVPFRVDVVGESFSRKPDVFETARERLGPRVGQFGYVESREEYVRLLWNADIVVSTAKQEFFGIAMAEAVWCGAWPIAPKALVYEDLYGGTGTSQHLYRDDAELLKLLEKALTAEKLGPVVPLRQRLAGFDWPRMAERFDQRFETLVAGAPAASRGR
jgi:glycosyltransferase involved in cell wall biosynthesis